MLNLPSLEYPPFSYLAGRDHEVTTAFDKSISKRAVILFNTWDEPPLYPPVNEDLARGERVHYDRMDGECSCEDHGRWLLTSITKLKSSEECNDDNGSSLLSVPLLGGHSRHGCESESLDMLVNIVHAKKALASRYNVYGVDIIEL